MRQIQMLDTKTANRLSEMYETLTSPSIRYDGMPHSSSAEDKMARVFSEMDELQRSRSALVQDLASQYHKAIRQMQEVITFISQYDGIQYQLLSARYIECLAWWQVAQAIGYSERWTKKLHIQIINSIEKKPR